ncbi:MAG: protein-L-isoaspartate(D-aspartate) O-methyltransferase [Saprospiraceae bacterium]|nr:protein-L-isoaspartate(D-aspartate) O-methyltransferase [Saprospiraceae bacterium]
MHDTFRLKGLRKKLTEHLKTKGIDDAILHAFDEVPRHWFMDADFDTWAYKDTAFKIDAEQTISHPFTVALMTTLLAPAPGKKILEIGTGSGYQACILAKLGAKVYTIERQKILYEKTSTLLNRIGFGSVRTLYGDGFLGAPRFAPFDGILVTAGVGKIPDTLLSQLKIGGTMVIPVGQSESQKMYKLIKLDEKTIVKEEHGNFQFVPFLPGVSI